MPEKLYINNGNLMYLYRVMKKYSSINYPLKIEEILKYIEKDYNIKLENRTIRRNFKVLEDKFNLIIERTEDGSYYMEPEDNDLEKSEIRTIIDIINYSEFVNDSLSRQLTNKLIGLLNKYDSEEFKEYKRYMKDVKTTNKQLFYTIDIVPEAIKRQKQIEVEYYKYNLKKEFEFRIKLKISPYIIFFEGGQYYLVGYHHGKEDIAYFRIDRIKNVRIIDEPYHKIKKIELEERINSTIGMYGGKIQNVEAICQKQLLDDVIDKFGHQVEVEFYDEDRFKLKVRTSLEGMKFWVLRNMNLVEVISPREFKQEIIDDLKDAIKKYEGNYT